MVSKAREDLPEPDRPVMTVSVSRGMSTSIPLRLCSRAPRTEIWVSMGFVVPDMFYGGKRPHASGCGVGDLGLEVGEGKVISRVISAAPRIPLFHAKTRRREVISLFVTPA